MRRDCRAEEPQLLHPGDQRMRVLVVVLQLACHRNNVAIDETAHRFDYFAADRFVILIHYFNFLSS